MGTICELYFVYEKQMKFPQALEKKTSKVQIYNKIIYKGKNEVIY